jgi:hypothetical protein
MAHQPTINTEDLLAKLEVLESRVRRLRLFLLALLLISGSAALLGFASAQDRSIRTQRLVLLDSAGVATGELAAREGNLLMRLTPQARQSTQRNNPGGVAGIMLSRENGLVVVGESGEVLARLGGPAWRWIPSQ